MPIPRDGKEISMSKKASAAPELESDTTKVEMVDEAKGLVDLDKDKEEGEADGEHGDAEAIAPEDEARNAIYAKHSELRKEELGITEEPEVKEEEKPEPEADEEITVTINGRTRKVLASKVEEAGGVDAYQKKVAGSELLEQAALERKRLADQQAELNRRTREVEQREQEIARAAKEKPTELPDTGALKTLAREYHEAMLDGDLDKADDLLIKMQAAQKATPVDPDAIATIAVKRAKEELTAEQREKQAADFESARAKAQQEFEENHEAIAADPELFEIVNAKTIEVRREHPDWGPKAIIDESVERVNRLVTRLKTPSSSEEKLTAKRGLTQVRGGSARSIPRPTPKPQTGSQYVEQLRKARGLD